MDSTGKEVWGSGKPTQGPSSFSPTLGFYALLQTNHPIILVSFVCRRSEQKRGEPFRTIARLDWAWCWLLLGSKDRGVCV